MRFKEIELKDICLDMHQGINTVADKVEYKNEGAPIIQSKNITSGYLDLEDVRYLDDETYLKYKDKYNPRKGDILLCNIGTIGASLVLNQDNKFLIAWNLFKLKINKELYDPKYIKYYLEKLRTMNYFDRLLTGGTVKFINKTKMGEIKIPICNIDEQYKIVGVLDKAQELIDKRKAQIEALDELVKSKFIEMFGDTITNPKEYENNCLESLADIVSGITKGRKTNNKELFQVPYMRVANVKDGYIDWSEIKTIDVTKEEIDRYRLLDDDVLMTEGGDADKLGRGSILYNPPNNCIHQNHIFRVRLNKDMINPVYFSEYLKHPLVKFYFLRSAKQTTGIASINMTQLKRAPILLPPIELQNEFAGFVKQIDKLKFEMQESLTQLEHNFNSLMQRAFKGELFN